jgi:hypothetical protein
LQCAFRPDARQVGLRPPALQRYEATRENVLALLDVLGWSASTGATAAGLQTSVFQARLRQCQV